MEIEEKQKEEETIKKRDVEDQKESEEKLKEEERKDVEGVQIQEELAKLKAELEERTKLANEYHSQLQYLRADMENLKKFAAKEKAEYIKSANEELVKRLLPVLDSFDSAMKAVKECKSADSAVSLAEGIEKLYRQLYEVLEREGLKPIAATGENFDPFRHEAVAVAGAESNAEENTILEELQKGYIFNSKVIRTSKVKVTKKV